MILDDVQQWWERLAARERNLFSLLGLALVIGFAGVVGYQIHGGLNELETANTDTRDALRMIDEVGGAYLTGKNNPNDPVASIVETAPPLTTYLEGIATEVGVQIPESSERQPVQKGKFQERAVDVKLRGVTTRQLSSFLQMVETRSQTVVTQRIYAKPQFNAHDKLDVELTVATYERPKKEKKSKDKGDSAEKDADAAGKGEEGKGS